MSDASREIVELRREIVEARNQAIKTDNQIKNLSLDVRGFEKRFDSLERRTRLSGIGVHAIVAVTIAVSAYFVHSVRMRQLGGEITVRGAELLAREQASEKAVQEARSRLSEIQQEKAKREKAAAVALKLVQHLDERREKEAVDLLDGLDVSTLTALESKLLDKRLGDLRARAAELAYKNGRAGMAAARPESAIPEFRRALALEPEGRFANAARYYLGTQLWALKRYEEVEPIFREIQKRDTDRGVLDETRYLLGMSLMQLGRRDDAKSVFTDVVQKGSRYSSNAREQLAALEATSGAAGEQPAVQKPAATPVPKKTEAPAAGPTPTAQTAPSRQPPP
jgi:TolA-binding protein